MMMANDQHPNVSHYLRTIQAFNDNDIETTVQLTDENVLYHVPGRSPLAGEFRGLHGFRDMLELAKQLSEGTLQLQPRAILANDEFLMVFGRISAQRRGKRLDGDHSVVFRFHNYKIIEGWTVPVDLYAFDTFWLS